MLSTGAVGVGCSNILFSAKECGVLLACRHLAGAPEH